MEQKSPDIIYAQIVAGTLYASRKPNEVFGEQFSQYIRKDTLLSKLTKLMDQAKVDAGGCSNMHASGKYIAYQEMVDLVKEL